MYRLIACAFALIALVVSGVLDRQSTITWDNSELARIKSLTLPSDTTLQNSLIHTGNQYWNNPAAAKLGQKLFFDQRLSKNGSIACANCHQPKNGFADPNPLSKGIATTKRHSPSLLGAAASPWQFWDGRADSLWAQALGPLEDPNEQGANRLQLVRIIHNHYLDSYQSLFTDLPDLSNLPKNATPVGTNTQWKNNWQLMTTNQQRAINTVFANIGKALAAYQNQLMPSESKFDQFAKQLLTDGSSEILNREEQQGLKLFIDDSRSQCMRCHNGPLFTNNDFQVTGIKDTATLIGLGRIEGIKTAINSEFNCAGPFSDVKDSLTQCLELNFAKREGDELNYAFKVPSLRNISKTAPYMHNGSMASLQDVLHFYTRAKTQYPVISQPATNKTSIKPSMQDTTADSTEPDTPHLDIEPLPLASKQLQQIEAFLLSLDSIKPLPSHLTTP